ncbi:MAG TPA: divalent-cation tolerance protein CutA [Terriglobales bacterium]|nr:divalent-cation tolerance protein CutA [Terriglobales bacterium]
MTDKVLILTTVGTEAEARKIAENLVDQRMAACVNIVPRIQSVYRWEGRVESAEELLLLIKTTKARAAGVQTAVRELHSYDLPEFVVVSMEDGSAEYLAWIDDSVRTAI